jgi:hypothetical protein
VHPPTDRSIMACAYSALSGRGLRIDLLTHPSVRWPTQADARRQRASISAAAASGCAPSSVLPGKAGAGVEAPSRGISDSGMRVYAVFAGPPLAVSDTRCRTPPATRLRFAAAIITPDRAETIA